MKQPITLLTALLLTPLAAIHASELRLATVISDHVVLQRDKAVPIWGWADPGEKVTVEFGGKTKTMTRAGVAADETSGSLYLNFFRLASSPPTITITVL